MENIVELVIYLAGRFMRYDKYDDWRDLATSLIKRIEEQLKSEGIDCRLHVIDPRKDTNQDGGFASFCQGDREHVLRSDIVFFFDVGPDGTSEDAGAVNEATIGIENKKTVIYCTEMSVVHPMVGNYCSGAVAVGLKNGIKWIESFARHGLKGMEAYHQIIESRVRIFPN